MLSFLSLLAWYLPLAEIVVLPLLWMLLDMPAFTLANVPRALRNLIHDFMFMIGVYVVCWTLANGICATAAHSRGQPYKASLRLWIDVPGTTQPAR